MVYSSRCSDASPASRTCPAGQRHPTRCALVFGQHVRLRVHTHHVRGRDFTHCLGCAVASFGSIRFVCWCWSLSLGRMLAASVPEGCLGTEVRRRCVPWQQGIRALLVARACTAASNYRWSSLWHVVHTSTTACNLTSHHHVTWRCTAAAVCSMLQGVRCSPQGVVPGTRCVPVRV